MSVTQGAFWLAITAAIAATALLVASGVGQQFNWELVIALLALAVAGYTTFLTHRFAKIDRAYSHSVYRSPTYLTAFDKLMDWFPELEKQRPEPCDPVLVWDTLEAFDPRRRQMNMVLNHWGMLASEYYADVVDRDRAREVLGLQFKRFFRYFMPYFQSVNPNTQEPILSPDLYRNTFRLVDEWRVRD